MCADEGKMKVPLRPRVFAFFMITVEEALQLILANLPERKSEQISFESALGRVLAENVAADCCIPPFNRSSMDGYALRASDTEKAPVELEVAGLVRAGGGDSAAVEAGQAVSIMTGAPVPEGADAVQIVEHTTLSDDGRRVTVLKPVKQGQNIVRRGSEAAPGDIVVEAGRVVGPGEIAVMATFGCGSVKVWRKPSVALLTTGDELIDARETPRFGQIRNSNAYSLRAQLSLMGIPADYMGTARDDVADLRRLMLLGLSHDVLILTGGVSMGKYDLVKDVFAELGIEPIFSKVAMKPGKPTVFARKEDKLVFGLPGNPVSAYIAFENFVRPALGRICGMANPELPRVEGKLLREMKQSPGRTAFLPARVRWKTGGWEIDPLPWRGSADIIGFSRGNAAVIFPGNRDFMAGGEQAQAMLLPGFFQRMDFDG